MAAAPVLALEGLTRSFGTLRAVDAVSLTVAEGEIFGILGPNGCGKTTLMRLTLGLLRPSAGRVSLLGRTMPDKGVLANVGYMPQQSPVYDDLTVRENVEFFASMCGGVEQPAVDHVLELVDLGSRQGSLVRTLSGGMKQRTTLACALVHRPRLLILDEPTVGVDPELRASFWAHFRWLAGQGTTILVTSHVMDEAERCDRLGLMRAGKLLATGTPAELLRLTQATTLEEAFLRYIQGQSGEAQP